jgi:hypothetical protein
VIKRSVIKEASMPSPKSPIVIKQPRYDATRFIRKTKDEQPVKIVTELPANFIDMTQVINEEPSPRIKGFRGSIVIQDIKQFRSQRIKKKPDIPFESSPRNPETLEGQAMNRFMKVLNKKIENLDLPAMRPDRKTKQEIFKLKYLSDPKGFPSLPGRPLGSRKLARGQISADRLNMPFVSKSFAGKLQITDIHRYVSESTTNMTVKAVDRHQESSIFKPDEEKLINILKIENHVAKKPKLRLPLTASEKRLGYLKVQLLGKDGIDEKSSKTEIEILQDYKNLYHTG